MSDTQTSDLLVPEGKYPLCGHSVFALDAFLHVNKRWLSVNAGSVDGFLPQTQGMQLPGFGAIAKAQKDVVTEEELLSPAAGLGIADLGIAHFCQLLYLQHVAQAPAYDDEQNWFTNGYIWLDGRRLMIEAVWSPHGLCELYRYEANPDQEWQADRRFFARRLN